jgi:hypothetical protein
MKQVVCRGSLAGVFLYASVGVFGYLTFYNNRKELEKKNILLTPYGSNVAIIIVSQIFSLPDSRPNSPRSSQCTWACPCSTYPPKKRWKRYF